MAVAPPTPMLVAFLGRLLARIGQSSFRWPRWLLRLLLSGRALLLLAFAALVTLATRTTLSLRAALALIGPLRPSIASLAAIASPMALAALVTAAASMLAIALPRFLRAALRPRGLLSRGYGSRPGFRCGSCRCRDRLGRFRRQPSKNLGEKTT